MTNPVLLYDLYLTAKTQRAGKRCPHCAATHPNEPGALALRCSRTGQTRLRVVVYCNVTGKRWQVGTVTFPHTPEEAL